jgi:hypothetical protein
MIRMELSCIRLKYDVLKRGREAMRDGAADSNGFWFKFTPVAKQNRCQPL